MAHLPPLATTTDLVTYGYDTVADAFLYRASARVRRFTRQRITPGTSVVVLHGQGPWLLPERPVREIVSVLDDNGQAVEHTLNGPFLSAHCRTPITVSYDHGFLDLPDGLVELVCSIASRLAQTPSAVAMGARTEQAGSETVTWGAEAYAGTTGLTAEERNALRALFPDHAWSVRAL
jgi:hypothetical protein